MARVCIVEMTPHRLHRLGVARFRQARVGQPYHGHGTLRHTRPNKTAVHAVSSQNTEVDTWQRFTDRVVGEWDGVCATFDADGEARELPEYYVPQAYRDWDVQLYDWQSQCSMNSTETGLMSVTRRMMPTVGCEADAIAFTEEVPEDLILGNSNAFYSSDGLATQSPGLVMADEKSFDCKAEHILSLENDRRIRMVHLLKKMGPERQWRVQGIEVHVEKKDSEYHGRRELTGCGGGMDPFAKTERLSMDEVATTFETGRSIASGFQLDGTIVSGDSWDFRASVAEGMTVVGLPKQCWTAFSCRQGEDGRVALRILAGALEDDGKSMVVASQSSLDGVIAEAALLKVTADAQKSPRM